MTHKKSRKKYLTGDKVAFRAFKTCDGDYLKDWLNNNKINYYLEMGYRPYRDKEVKLFIDKAINSDTDIVFTILDNNNYKVIGTCGLYNLDFISKRGQLNIIIGDEKYLSNGYGTDSVKLLLQYGFKRLGLNSIQLGVNAENQAIKSYKNAGFVLKEKDEIYIR